MIEAIILGLCMFLLVPVLGYESLYESKAMFIAFALVLIGSFPALYAMLKGAPFVPTPRKKLQKMVELAKINSNSIIYDLGSGDGRFVFAAQKAGAKKAIGYELSLPLIIMSKLKSLFYKNTKFYCRDFWINPQKFQDADVIFCFLLVKPMLRFYKEIWPHLKKGTLVISNTFSMPDLTPIYKENGIVVYKK